ncbi:RelA/SpoT domain-containing protein [Pseudomonas sp. TE24901]
MKFDDESSIASGKVKMAWVKPAYSKERVKKAGMALISDTADFDEIDQALEVLNNWRSIHSYPVNTFQASLRAKLNKLNLEATVAQRLKRIPSILAKLHRFPKMSLSRMQDIGGLRAVVESSDAIYKLWDSYRESRFDHVLVSEYDYIAEPKASGYRGIHLIYKYNNRKGDGPSYEGLQLEIQIRNRIQHAWATAVETAGVFLEQALKSSIGNEKWLEFFAYASSSFAIVENLPVFEGHRTLTQDEIFDKTLALEVELEVISKLEMYKAVVEIPKDVQGKAHYFLMELQPKDNQIEITGYARAELVKATEDYLEAEKTAKGSPEIQIVLVAAQSLESLKKAYPNYFLDTKHFVENLRKIREAQKRKAVKALPALPKK